MNGIIIVDKPTDWTSHDVVGKLRGIFHERRIGHSGTLDPMATGVLPVFVGRATRGVEFCEADEKEYIAGLRLGVVTDTQDTTGTVLEERPCTVSEEEVRAVLAQFTGEIQQMPPMYSAVKIGGKKLYELARKGVEVERKPRTITIYELELLPGDDGDYQLRVVCSKGTYIRTLCHDIGQTLGCGGTMSSLRRIRAGRFSESDAVSIEEIQAAAADGRLEEYLRPLDDLFANYPAYVVGPKQERLCRNGNTFKAADFPGGYCRVYGQDNAFLMLGYGENGTIKTVKSFFEV